MSNFAFGVFRDKAAAVQQQQAAAAQQHHHYYASTPAHGGALAAPTPQRTISGGLGADGEGYWESYHQRQQGRIGDATAQQSQQQVPERGSPSKRLGFR